MIDENEVKALAERVFAKLDDSFCNCTSIAIAEIFAREALRWRDETRPLQAPMNAFAIAHTAAKMTAEACKSATGRYGTINTFVNLVQIANDVAAQAPPAAAVSADTHGDEFGRGWNACRAAMLAAAPAQQPAALAVPANFTEWLAREMPAGTVIGDPHWWAKLIARRFAQFAAKENTNG